MSDRDVVARLIVELQAAADAGEIQASFDDSREHSATTVFVTPRDRTRPYTAWTISRVRKLAP